MDDLKLSNLIDLIADRFKQRLQRKNGWGKNEVQLELQKAISQALADLVDQPEIMNS